MTPDYRVRLRVAVRWRAGRRSLVEVSTHTTPLQWLSKAQKAHRAALRVATVRRHGPTRPKVQKSRSRPSADAAWRGFNLRRASGRRERGGAAVAARRWRALKSLSTASATTRECRRRPSACGSRNRRRELPRFAPARRRTFCRGGRSAPATTSSRCSSSRTAWCANSSSRSRAVARARPRRFRAAQRQQDGPAHVGKGDARRARATGAGGAASTAQAP